MTNSDQKLNNYDEINVFNEIDINSILETILRKRKLVLTIATSVLFLTFCYAFTRKQIWKGEFEIVLNQTGKSSVGSALLNNLNNSAFKGLLSGSFTQNTNLKTEVEILKSPSVLKPIFDFVKQQKKIKGKNVDNFNFIDWSNNVNVGLKEKTSVLALSYKDTDKDIILPVINKISDAYKNYPNRDKSRGLLESIKYFDDQIAYYLDLSEKAFRDYIAFSLENNLSGLPPNLPRLGNDNEQDSQTVFDVDPRLLIQSQIKELDVAINEIQDYKLSEYDDRVLPLLSYYSEDKEYESLEIEIKNKVVELSQKRQFFTEEDKSVQELKTNIKDLNRIILNSAKDNLKNQRRNLQIRLKILSKPKDIIIKYKEMQREVIRLEKIVSNLENNKQLISLQLAEKSNPWELISTPTLLENPIAPRKKIILFLGLISGISLGASGALYAERFSGILYNIKEIKYLINYKFLKEIDIRRDNWEESIILIGKNINYKNKINNLGLVSLNNLSKNNIQKIKHKISNSIANITIVNSNNFNDLISCDSILLIIEKGKVTRKELAEYDQKLKLLDNPNISWIILRSF